MTTVEQETHAGPRVRLRWRIEVSARDLEGDDQALHQALSRGTAGMAGGVDVVLEVHGPIRAAAGAGTRVGMVLADTRSVEVLAGGWGAPQFTEELQRAASAYVPWAS